MANAFTVYAKLILDSSGYDKALEDAKGKAGGIGKALGTAMKVGAGAIAAATTAVTAFAGESVKVGAGFDSAMAQVAATMGKTVDEIGELRDFAQEMGSTTAFSASQAADALNYMALAGYDAETSMQMLPNVLNLAAAGGIELATASDMVTDAQSALGISLEETTALVDKMARTSSKSNTSVAQLGDAILTVGGTAKTLAGGTTELSQALGLLADNGIKGAEGGTALRNIILSLSAPTDNAAAALEGLGVSVFDAEGDMRPLADIFADMNKGLESLSGGEKINALSNIFNKVDLKSANALLATSVERWEELGTAINDASGAAAQMAETQLDNLNGDITLFKSALEGAQIAISEGLMPDLREFVQFGSDGLSRLTKAFKEEGLSGAMDALGDVISDGLGMVMQRLPEIVEAGAKLLSALIDGIIKNLPLIANAALQILLSLAQGIIDHLPELIPAIVEVVTQIVETLTEPETLEKLILAGLAILGAVVIGILKALPVLLAGLGKVLENILTAIGNWMYALYEKGREIVNSLAKGVADAARDAVQWGRDLIDNFVRGIRERIQRVIDAVKDVAQNVRNYLGFSEPKLGPLSNFHTYAPDMMRLFAQGIKDNEGLVTDQINKSFDFGVRTMDFGANATGGAGYNAPYGGGFGGTGGGEQTINVDVTLRLDDGTVLQKFAHRLRPYLNTEAALAGGVLS